MYPSKVLEFSGDHFDSETAWNGEFRLLSKMSDFDFFDVVLPARKKKCSEAKIFEILMWPLKVHEIFRWSFLVLNHPKRGKSIFSVLFRPVFRFVRTYVRTFRFVRTYVRTYVRFVSFRFIFTYVSFRFVSFRFRSKNLNSYTRWGTI